MPKEKRMRGPIFVCLKKEYLNAIVQCNSAVEGGFDAITMIHNEQLFEYYSSSDWQSRWSYLPEIAFCD